MVTWTEVACILKISICYCNILYLIVITDCNKLKNCEVRVDSHGTALLPDIMQICWQHGYLKSLPFVSYNGVNRVVWQGPLKIKFCAILMDSHNEVNLCSSRHAGKWKCCIDSATAKHIEFCFITDELFMLSAWTSGKFTEGKLYLIDYYHKQKESNLFIKSHGDFLGTSRPYIEVSVSLI